MKTLLLTTYDFPFGRGEAFLESEMPVLSQHFSQIYILPIRRLWQRSSPLQHRELPENVSIVLPYRYGLRLCIHLLLSTGKILRAYRALLSRTEMCAARPGLRDSIALLLRRLRWAFVEGESRRIQQQVGAKRGYAYWKSGCAYPLSRLKEEGLLDAVVARAHHHDLYPSLFQEGYNPYDEYLIKQLDCIYSISNDGIRVLKEIGYPEASLQLSRLGVVNGGKVNSGSSDGVLRLISVSRVERIKRLDLLVQAFALISESMKIQWTHFGDGSQMQHMRDLVGGLPENIEVVLKGEQPNIRVLNHYKSEPVDMLVNVSESEGIPVSIMEALAHGVPCVATDVGATREIVNSSNGCLLPANPSATDIANSIMELRGKILSGEDFSQRAKMCWAEYFDREKNYKAFAQHLSRI